MTAIRVLASEATTTGLSSVRFHGKIPKAVVTEEVGDYFEVTVEVPLAMVRTIESVPSGTEVTLSWLVED